MPRSLSRSVATARALGMPQRARLDDEPVIADAAWLPDEPGVVRHPDGYYWQADDGGSEFGPFDTLEAALADRQAGEDADLPPSDALLEVEDELGISGWIDPDTGSPAEQTCTRLEDH